MSEITFNSQSVFQEQPVNKALWPQRLNPLNWSRTIKILSIAGGVLLTGVVSYLALNQKKSIRPLITNTDAIAEKKHCYEIKPAQDFFKNLNSLWICEDDQGKINYDTNLEGEAIVKTQDGITRDGTFRKGVLIKGKWEKENGETRTGDFNFDEPNQILNGTIIRPNKIKETGHFALNRHGNFVLNTLEGILEFPDEGIKIEGQFRPVQFKFEKTEYKANVFLNGDVTINNEITFVNRKMILEHRVQPHNTLFTLEQNQVLEKIQGLYKKHGLLYFRP